MLRKKLVGKILNVATILVLVIQGDSKIIAITMYIV